VASALTHRRRSCDGSPSITRSSASSRNRGGRWHTTLQETGVPPRRLVLGEWTGAV
jgi:hypothetical protein